MSYSLATHRDVTGEHTDGHQFQHARGAAAADAPRGEEREDVERAEEAAGHGLAQELPERGRVMREAEVGDEDPGQVGAG